jgi:hypothetical protein
VALQALDVTRSKVLHPHAVVSVETLDGLIDRSAVWLQSFIHRTEKYDLHKLMLRLETQGCQILSSSAFAPTIRLFGRLFRLEAISRQKTDTIDCRMHAIRGASPIWF